MSNIPTGDINKFQLTGFLRNQLLTSGSVTKLDLDAAVRSGLVTSNRILMVNLAADVRKELVLSGTITTPDIQSGAVTTSKMSDLDPFFLLQ